MSFKSELYDNDVFTIKKYNENFAQITYLSSCRRSGYENETKRNKKNSVNNNKLENNLSRAKSKFKEYVLCNEWSYWCTFTISPQKYNRFDLTRYQKDFSEFIHNENRLREIKIKYLFIPEMHKDGAWHIHGFINGLIDSDIITNSNGYLSWKKYNDKFGFMSMDKIRNIDRASNYALKYMTKDNLKNVTELGAHLYYCSKGLNTAERIYKGCGILHSEWSWEHPDGFCKIKNVDLRYQLVEEIFEVL